MSFKKIVYTLLSFSVSGLLFWYVYRDSNMSGMLKHFKNINIVWFSFSILFGFFAYIVRAFRWQIALEPLGYKVSLLNSSMAVIIGYFANLFLPRVGEIVRCSVLKKTDQVSVKVSFGTVITERIVDLILLTFFICCSFLLQLTRIKKLLIETLNYNFNYSKIAVVLALTLLLFLIFIILLKKNHKRLKRHSIYRFGLRFLIDFKKGLTSVKYMNKKNKIKYIVSSLLIWVLYYYMFYMVFISVNNLGAIDFDKILFVFTMGCIGMIMPTPGGVGAFHLLTSASLISYNVSKEASNFVALILHGGQYFGLWLTALLTLIVLAIVLNRSKK